MNVNGGYRPAGSSHRVQQRYRIDPAGQAHDKALSRLDMPVEAFEDGLAKAVN